MHLTNYFILKNFSVKQTTALPIFKMGINTEARKDIPKEKRSSMQLPDLNYYFFFFCEGNISALLIL